MGDESQFLKRERKLGDEFVALFDRCALPRGDHDEIPDADGIFPYHAAVRFADDPFGPIADDGSSDLLRDGQSDPIDADLFGVRFLQSVRRVIGEEIDREGRGHESLAFRVRFGKQMVFADRFEFQVITVPFFGAAEPLRSEKEKPRYC